MLIKTLLIEDELQLATMFMRAFPTLCDNLHLVGTVRALHAALEDYANIIVSDKTLTDGSTVSLWSRYLPLVLEPKRVIVYSGDLDQNTQAYAHKLGFQVVTKPDPEGLRLAIKIAQGTFQQL